MGAQARKHNDEKQQRYCQWFTPPGVALPFLEWADIGDEDIVLEPAAGEGALVPNRSGVVAIERDEELIAELKYWRPEATIVHGDFLLLPTPTETGQMRADVAVLNPPYSGIAPDGEGTFIYQSLQWAPRACALIRTVGLHGRGRFEKCWRYVRPTRIALLTDRPKYLGPGGRPSDMHPFTEYCAVECVLRDEVLPLEAYEVYKINCEVQWVGWK